MIELSQCPCDILNKEDLIPRRRSPLNLEYRDRMTRECIAVIPDPMVIPGMDTKINLRNALYSVKEIYLDKQIMIMYLEKILR